MSVRPPWIGGAPDQWELRRQGQHRRGCGRRTGRRRAAHRPAKGSAARRRAQGCGGGARAAAAQFSTAA